MSERLESCARGAGVLTRGCRLLWHERARRRRRGAGSAPASCWRAAGGGDRVRGRAEPALPRGEHRDVRSRLSTWRRRRTRSSPRTSSSRRRGAGLRAGAPGGHRGDSRTSWRTWKRGSQRWPRTRHPGARPMRAGDRDPATSPGGPAPWEARSHRGRRCGARRGRRGPARKAALRRRRRRVRTRPPSPRTTVAQTAPAVRRDGAARAAEIGSSPWSPGSGCRTRAWPTKTWGAGPDGSNAVLVEHALTGDSHAARGTAVGNGSALRHGRAPCRGGHRRLVGRATDRERPSTPPAGRGARDLGGPPRQHRPGEPRAGRRTGGVGAFHASPCGTPWPREARLADRLGIRRWRLVVGGSMGGARALERAVRHPVAGGGVRGDRRERRVSAEQLARAAPVGARDPAGPALPRRGLRRRPAPRRRTGLARRIAHITHPAARTSSPRASAGRRRAEARRGRRRDRGRHRSPAAGAPPARTAPWTGRYRAESYWTTRRRKAGGPFRRERVPRASTRR
ncbi:hypothetical protein QJS66_07200 [Kocuria rhizophila]|nr:hypothetical protein QJS66_07200 [Kocuria rhizophila]